MAEKTKAVGHYGTKTLALVVGLVLAIIYTILQFFQNKMLTIDSMYNIALVTVFFVFVIPAIIYLAQLLWQYVHGLGEKIGVTA